MTLGGRLRLFPLLRVAVMLILGIVAGDAWHADVSPVLWIVVTSAMLALSFCVAERPVAQSVLIMSAIFFLGAWLIAVCESEARISLPDGRQRYCAVVASTPVERGKVVACDLLVTDGRLAGRKVKAGILRDTIHARCAGLKVGVGIEAESVFEYPGNYRAGSNFDYKRWMMVQGYAARTLVFHDGWKPRAVPLSGLSRLERAKITALKFRERLLERYRSGGADSQAYAVVAAMTLGEKSALSRELKNVYSVTGASHILALSGLHLGIIYVMLSSLLPRRRSRLFGQAAIVVAIWAYALMVGMSPSVVRAATMFSVYAMVSLLNRDRMSLNTLSLAAVVMLCLNPLCLWDVGFQMSFLAVLGIFVFYPSVYNVFAGGCVSRFALFRWFWGMAAVSIAAQLCVAPLVMYYFGSFPCYFLMTNMVAIPMATIIIYCAFLMFLFSPLPVMQGWVADALFAFASWLNEFLGFVSALPGASVDGISVNKLQLALMYVFLASFYGLCVYAARMRRSARHTWK